MNLGVIGKGWSANRFLRVAKRVDGVRIRALATKPNYDRAALQELRASIGCEYATNSIEEILTDPMIDAVVVSTPPKTHVAISKSAINAGKHLIVEKPVGMSEEEAKELEILSRSRKKVVFVPYHLNFNPLVRRFGSFVQRSEFGRMRHMKFRMNVIGGIRGGWVNEQNESGGVVRELLVHGLSLFNYLFGVPGSITAFGERTASGLVESCTAILESRNGFIANLEADMGSTRNIPFGFIECVGTLGGATLTRGLFNDRRYELSVDLERPVKVKRHWIVRDDDIGFVEMLKEFKERVDDGTPDWKQVEAACTVQYLTKLIFQSLDERKTVIPNAVSV